MVEKEKAQLQRLEVDLVADDRERRIVEKRLARGPFETAGGARFEFFGFVHDVERFYGLIGLGFWERSS